MHSKNRRLVIPQDLTNFINTGTHDPNQSQTSIQPGLHQTSPLSTEEWVDVEDFYSDEEHEAKTDQIDGEVQTVGHVVLGAARAYYLDFAPDEDVGAVVEAQMDSQLGDLELLFQEKLTTLAEDAVEQHALRKGKAVLIDCEPDCPNRQ